LKLSRSEHIGGIMQAPMNQESINDTAKLMMHRLIARLLARDPLLIDRARASLARMSARFPDRTFITEWEELLRLPSPELRRLLISRNEDMRCLHLSSPFVVAEGVDFGDQNLRRRIRRAAKRIAARAMHDASGHIHRNRSRAA
jgi:hypothetical protein